MVAVKAALAWQGFKHSSGWGWCTSFQEHVLYKLLEAQVNDLFNLENPLLSLRGGVP